MSEEQSLDQITAVLQQKTRQYASAIKKAEAAAEDVNVAHIALRQAREAYDAAVAALRAVKA